MKSLILSAILGVTVLASDVMANPFNTADDGFSKEVLIYTNYVRKLERERVTPLLELAGTQRKGKGGKVKCIRKFRDRRISPIFSVLCLFK